MRFIVPALLISSVILPSCAWALDCKKMLQTHGFKAAAQVSCNYGQRPNAGIEAAKACANRQTPEANVSEIRMGASVFQVTEMRMGHDALCQDVLQKFPGLFIPN